MAYATVEQLSNVLNLTPRRINQLVKDEGMPRVSRGEYEMVKCVQWYIRYLRGQLEVARHGTETEAQARLRLIQTTADLRKLDLAERTNELISIDDVILEVTPVFRAMRMRLLGVPKRAAHRVKGAKDYNEIVEIFDDFIREVLIDLSTLPEQLAAIDNKKMKMRRAARDGSSGEKDAELEDELVYQTTKKKRIERKRKKLIKKRREIKSEIAATQAPQGETSEPEEH